jgi:hypothetical protein
MGPYTVDEIVNFVSQGTLSPLDYLYDEQKGDWFLFLDHEALADKVKALKPKAPPRAAEVKEEPPAKAKKASAEKGGVPTPLAEQMQHEWFILKGENKFGPFAYTDVVKMLQQGVVFEFDFAWHGGMAGWERIADVKAFDKEHIKQLKETAMPEISEVFFRRRYRRVRYGGTILVHDNKKVWKGKGVEISEGGAGVIMENAMVLPGQELYLHFKPGDGVPPFNAVCEVVSKQYVSDIVNPQTPIKYGLKFKNVSTEAEKFLKDFTKKAA